MTTQMEEVLTLALQLSPADRLRLVEHVVASVGQEIAHSTEEPQADEHWGEHLVQLVEELDLTDWTDIDEDDPVEWVRRLRQNQK